MQAFRIRRGDSERSVSDTSALLALASAGELRPTDEVETADGWVAASTLPVLRGRFGGDDPWAAWSDVESVDAASLYKRMVDEPDELPVEALAVVGAPADASPVRVDAVVELDADALVPVDAAPVGVVQVPGPRVAGATAPTLPGAKEPLPLSAAARTPARALPPGEVGELIDFPRVPTRPAPVDLPMRPSRARVGPPPLVRTSRVVGMVVAGLLVVLVGYAYMRMTAFSRAGVSAPVAARTAPGAPAEVSPLVLLDAELRRSLPSTPRAVKQAGDLSDALLLELVSQKLAVESAEGLVTKWVGRLGDEPQSAEVRVRYTTNGDIGRELGAIALVVGRYKRFYRLQIPVFEVTELSSNGVTLIDAERAEAYYQARLSLQELLASISGK